MGELSLGNLTIGKRYRVVLTETTGSFLGTPFKGYNCDFIGEFKADIKAAGGRYIQFDLSMVGEGIVKCDASMVSAIYETNQKIRGIRPALAETRVF